MRERERERERERDVRRKEMKNVITDWLYFMAYQPLWVI